jgi:outer membrane protein OmpA-like peptidoglycan-associated protein
MSIGVPADKLETLSQGSEEAKKYADAATMATDRRVDLVILM